MPRGGKRQGAGRKKKTDEDALMAKLSPLDEAGFAALQAGVERGDYQFTKMFFEYRFGKPQDKVDITSGGEAITGIKLVDVDGTEI
jgi:hypothetical protein